MIRDVGRVLGHPYGFVDRISKLIPPDPGMTGRKRLKTEPQLPEIYEADEVKSADRHGAQTGRSPVTPVKHAGGVGYRTDQITDFAPLYCDEEGKHPVTQFDKAALNTPDW